MNLLFMASHWVIRKLINTLLKNLLKLRNRHLLMVDILIFAITPLLALILRLDGDLTVSPYMSDLANATILFVTVKISIFCSFKFYQRYWRYASVEELSYVSILMTGAVATQIILFDILQYTLPWTLDKLPRSLPYLDGLLSCLLIGALRFSVRVLERTSKRRIVLNPKQIKQPQRVLVVGAGSAGVSLVQEMQVNLQIGLQPIGFVDDDPAKLNVWIRGIPVLGDRYQIPHMVESLGINKVIIAMPTVAGGVIREIVDICATTGAHTSTLPAIHEILNGRVRVDSIRDVRIEDLLRREPVQIDIERVSQFLQGKKVLITGAGGSIGSELCRQILKCHPAQIMLVGHGENSVFGIEQELNQLVQALKLEYVQECTQISAFIADIRERNRLEHAFAKYRPDVVFHAAAHKHVPLMELNSPEAITNNVKGTKNLLDLALQYNVNHFVMISTDKAVNPTNIMGASKRVAEMLVLQAALKSGRSYVAVRFGNVLGSRGSVVPTFKKQIAAGGPITVTHPDICRYFMTIPEAVQLVLQASVLGRGGEVLMLNMGKPVKIVDLAAELIRLSGYEVNKDIDIVFSGLRPGEKLFEELFIEGEEYEPTEHEKLLVVKNASRIVPDNLMNSVEALCKAASANDSDTIMLLLDKLVLGYQPKCLENQGQREKMKNRDIKTNSNGKIFTNVAPKRA